MTTTSRARLGSWILRLVILLQLLSGGSAVDGIWNLIEDGTPVILPGVLAVPAFAAACYMVALAASFGRAEQMGWRMSALLAGEAGAAAAMIWGMVSGGLALAGTGPALGQIGEPAKGSVPLLLLQVRDGTDPFMRQQAAAAVDRIDPNLARRCTTSSTLAEAARQAALRREPVSLRPECAGPPESGQIAPSQP